MSKNYFWWRLVVVLWLGSAWSQAEPPPGYYDAAAGKTGAALRDALHAIVRNHHVLPYSGSIHPNTGDALRVLDEDPANTNNVIGIYSRYSILKANLGSSAGTWNREHRWCNSYGLNDTPPPYTDLNNLCVEEANVNSLRGNNYYDFSNRAGAGYKVYSNAAAGVVWSCNSATFEPPDATKGDCARAMLYMAIRYTGDNGEARLSLTDNTGQIVAGGTCMGRYTTLLRWHFMDPVSPEERARNDLVYSFQTNRNPFIDHPEWVAAAFLPQVDIARVGNRITLAWTNDMAPVTVVEQSTNLMADWVTLTNTASLSSSNWSLSLPAQSGVNFYRLRLQ